MDVIVMVLIVIVVDVIVMNVNIVLEDVVNVLGIVVLQLLEEFLVDIIYCFI